jgi:hypothetical protein
MGPREHLDNQIKVKWERRPLIHWEICVCESEKLDSQCPISVWMINILKREIVRENGIISAV